MYCDQPSLLTRDPGGGVNKKYPTGGVNSHTVILNIAAREHPRAGSKQMATYQAVVAQTQSSSSSSNLCCSVHTQTRSAHHVACSLLYTIHYASSMNAVWRTPIIQPRPQTALLLLLLYIFFRTRSSMLAALFSLPLFFPPVFFPLKINWRN